MSEEPPPRSRPRTQFKSAKAIKFASMQLTSMLRGLAEQSAPLEFQLIGRMLLLAAVVGAAAGLLTSVFVALAELIQSVMLADLTGFRPLHAAGEAYPSFVRVGTFRPWLLVFVPAFGALVAGFISWRFAPETFGGGADSVIHAFHNSNGVLRRRVMSVRTLVSAITLGTGSSGGREGPVMQLGGAIGSTVGRVLEVSERERRILLVAGAAAGMSAVSRTPLGAALLAVEVLHRDDFESDALVPAVLSSVVSYSVFISLFGESTLFAHSSRYPFVPTQLPLYILMALIVSTLAHIFVAVRAYMTNWFRNSKIPVWVRPAVGGLGLAMIAVPMILIVGHYTNRSGQGLGILGGGYGAAQMAIRGVAWFPGGWSGVGLMFGLAIIKIFATSLTVGSGASAGDFGPSLVIGGLCGGAFGRAAQITFHDPHIVPGAFALAGMGTFYGGVAHVPIASLVMVSELAGSYDLLVPMMFCGGISFMALRSRCLYPSQVLTKRDSPAHRNDLIFDVLRTATVGDVLVRDRPYITFPINCPGQVVVKKMADNLWQDVFPVLGDDGLLKGMITADILRSAAAEPNLGEATIAYDMMVPAIAVKETDDLHTALESILANAIRELIVTDHRGKIVGFLDETEITKVYHLTTEAQKEAAEAARE
jgi:chloride channel protein, CIC family